MIGLVAAYGMVVGIQEIMKSRGRVKESEVERICRRLEQTRPTAVNLFWALNRMRSTYNEFKGRDGLLESMLQAAIDMHVEDVEIIAGSPTTGPSSSTTAIPSLPIAMPEPSPPGATARPLASYGPRSRRGSHSR